MANLIKIADLLKNAPDQALMQEMQNPTGTAPSYMILSELQRRKKLRGSLMNNEPQTSVAEDMEAEASQAEQMGTAGLGSMGPAPMQQPQGYAQGGAVQGYAYGGDVDYQDDLPWDERMRMWREMTGFGRMAPPPAPAQPTFPGAAAAQVRTADNRVVATPQVRPQPAAPRAPAQVGIASVNPAAAKSSDDYSVSPLLEEARGIRKQLADAYKSQADVYKQQSDEVRKTKDVDAAMALLTAGFGIAGGRSQNAIENIGQGALPAVQQYAGAERARREQLQKLAMGQGALGIEQLGAQMKGVTAEGELGLGGEKMDIARRSAAADEMRARASAASVANQASQWKQDNAAGKLDLNRATEIRNYIDKNQMRLTPEQIAGLEAQYAQLMKFDTMGALPKGIKVTPLP